ncbi:MAG: ArsC family transcriptional regulator [Candidatus Edwardsbacteria bacterium RIFOXYD12_FULL_50_11]|uniref:ArsC family transcriptional regulator n=1 Tax=Candidatus Edwardsbacteria bacterium GWF2_54_11 TaxID=1817851 RepID=A0A1F5RCY1_9BACT|nr:MAG: ArsC family transcriptional regulator [Candidatus Edwardsbacteria bacterium RifOxyC12_full_54_24]OGF07706.1 MAG: ArsC family transcriptional regulator [Candidatus Edwardsbacteria bacterium RifOxyA12_full_54_48]OGF09957.1 MAG: ArsC family transcriptional regulator [Candidatus Edwardsbacteria bacterium GWE2_54_12]OGF12218.1 MAG: ArsC family transcriptional regulator [Candidatus Edwardsbacteria bacterium GWF2_54_11]OGF16318.1 MAG: ArsC family transcriptional regulator [Candidatus Edwardsba
MPVIQIFGTVKCRDTRAAQRFFKERRLKFQFIDLNQKALSRGELNSVKNAVGLENLLDAEGKEYQRQNLKYQKYDIEQVLLENPGLFRTPIVRCGPKATVGYQPEVWQNWLEAGT